MFTKIFNRFSTKPFLTISLLGRTSVGKSSLFNKLQSGENQAITSDQKSITRDRMEAYSDLFQMPVRFVDTAGIENVALQKLNSPLQQKMLIQTLNALEYSDIALFVVDGQSGLTSIDYQIAQWLKKNLNIQDPKMAMVGQLKELQLKTKIRNALLVANKCENERQVDLKQMVRLGFGNPICVSAHDGTGIQDLLAAIAKHIPKSAYEEFENLKEIRKEKYKKLKAQCREEMLQTIKEREIEFDIKQWEREFDLANPDPANNSDLDDDIVYKGSIIQEKSGVSSENIMRNNPIMLAIMGRQNVGKSSLVNRILGNERVIADSTPGTTRDPISTEWTFKGQKIQLVDTAGVFKQNQELSQLDIQIQSKTRYIMRYSHVIVVLIDSLGALRNIDLDLMQEVCKEGRAVILGINKWDMVDKEYKPKILKFLNRQLEQKLSEIPKCIMIPLSAEKNMNIDLMMDNILKIYDAWNTRISTGLLNEWLDKLKKIQNLPSDDGDKLRIKFISQVKVRPPTFALFVNEGSLFKKNYIKFLRKKLGQEFNIEGVPIRLVLRDIEYAKEKKELEKKHTDTSVKEELLKKRKMYKIAKMKLQQLRKSTKI